MKSIFSGVFYGWWIVAASFFTALYVGGAVFYGFTAMFEPIAKELGWSYTQVSLAASLRGLEMGLLAPVIGVLTDRWGPRRLVLIGSILGGLGLLLLSRTTSLGLFYTAFVLIAIGMSTCTMTVLMTAVASWFRRRVGIATGIAICGFGFGGLMVPAIVGLIEAFDWRAAVTILALGMLVIPLPLSAVFRHRPEQYGHLPDGDSAAILPAPADETPDNSNVTGELHVGGMQALRSATFWKIALAFTCHAFLVLAIITHVMPYLSSIGVGRSTSSLVATAIPVASIVGRLGFGWFSDHFSRRVTTAVGFAMLALGLLSFAYADLGLLPIILFLVLFGPGYGGLNVMRPSLIQEYFGRGSFGTVFGLVIGISMLGSIAGPTLAGWAFDTQGTYRIIWLVMAAAPLVAVIASLSLVPSRSAPASPHR